MNIRSATRPHLEQLFAVLLTVVLLGGCNGDAPQTPATVDSPPPASDQVATEPPIFVDEAAATGLDFVHFNGMTGQFYYSEMMGSGAALFDYDQDGDLDVYLVQGERLDPSANLDQTTFPPRPEMMPLRGRLFRNDLSSDSDRPVPRFTDVTESSGLDAVGYGMGVASGDVDRNGFPDLYLTFAGPDQLWLNNGDGTFRQATPAAIADDDRWSASAALVDVDADGWLDLYVTYYVDFDVATHKLCRTMTGAPDYCGPLAYPAEPDRLYRNRGAPPGVVELEDVTARAGISGTAAGLGVVDGDFDADGRTDFYVANDGMANFLWLQQADGTFVDQALASGTALSREGQAEAGMGVAVGDVDNDGDEDLLITHLALETNTLYRNLDQGFFADDSLESGLGSPSWPMTGFGAAFLDFDNDGWLDLLTVNGAVRVLPELAATGDPYPIHMPNQLFHNHGQGAFEEISQRAGEAFTLSEVSRGVAVGDVDNDGDPDVLISNNSGPARLLIDQVGQDRAWLGLRLVAGNGYDVLGAEAVVKRSDGLVLTRRSRTAGSYLSASDPRLLFGLGDAVVESVEVRWPDGSREAFSVETGRYNTLERGTGAVLAR